MGLQGRGMAVVGWEGRTAVWGAVGWARGRGRLSEGSDASTLCSAGGQEEG